MRCIGLITHTASRQELSKSHEVIAALMIFTTYSILLLKLLVKHLLPCFPPLMSWTLGKLGCHYIALLLLQDEVRNFKCFALNLFDFFKLCTASTLYKIPFIGMKQWWQSFNLFYFLKSELVTWSITNCSRINMDLTAEHRIKTNFL